MNTNFNFSMGVLTQRADHIANLLERDAEQFAPLGYNETFVQQLRSKLIAFKELLSDDYWLGQQILKTDAKNTAFDTLKHLLATLRFRCKFALGEKSPEYKALHFNKLKNVRPSELIHLARHICLTCREMLEVLASRNIKDEVLIEIESAAQLLDDAIDEQKELISTREAKTLERKTAANEIYALISEVCEVGKNVWNGVNDAFYHDYVIYGSKHSVKEDEEIASNEEEPVAP